MPAVASRAIESYDAREDPELIIPYLLEQFFWRRHSVAIAEQAEQLLPVDISIQPHSNPAAGPYISW